MKIYELLWPDDQMAHIAEHAINPEEVEEGDRKGDRQIILKIFKGIGRIEHIMLGSTPQRQAFAEAFR